METKNKENLSIVISGETMNYIVTYIDEERIINL